MNRRSGFTLVELLVVMIVLGILAGLSLLKAGDLRNSAVAAQMSQDLHAVTVAAYNYYSDKEEWPAESGAGQVPAGLGPLLPGQLSTSFDREKYVLDYENFGAGGGEVIIGVSVSSTDSKLFAKFVAYLGNKSPYFLAGSKITYLIAGPGGVF